MSKPAGTTAMPNTTIASGPFNTLIDDIVADLNAARPVTAGGTGAVNAGGALTNLGITAFAQTLLDDADAAAARVTLLTGPRPIVFSVAGGDETAWVGTVKEIRLAAAFIATAPTAIINYSCAVASLSGASFTAFLQGGIRDAVNNFLVVGDTPEVVAAGGSGQVICVARTLTIGNLVVGTTYQAVLYLRSNVAGTFTPQGMTINGINA